MPLGKLATLNVCVSVAVVDAGNTLVSTVFPSGVRMATFTLSVVWV